MEHLSSFFHALVVHFGYAGLFVVMFLGNIGMPTGTEIVMPSAGALAATGHLPPFGPLPGWSIAGAVGALCVIFAVTNAGKGGAIYVAPLVFAGAPIINTIATITYFHPVKTLPDWRFFLGLLLAAVGAAMVMIYKPLDQPTHAATAPVHAPAKSVESHS